MEVMLMKEPNGISEIIDALSCPTEPNRTGFRRDLDNLFKDQQMIGEDFRIAIRKLLEEYFPGKFYQV